VRTSLPAEALDDAAVVRSYKSLSLVERAFRCIKTVDRKRCSAAILTLLI
jgi:hypothetical protein